jgi:hypothetical protein
LPDSGGHPRSRGKVSGHPRVCRCGRGRLVFDLSLNPFIPTPYLQFVAHSIIKTPDGKLLDITPPTTTQPYPFIRHPDGNEDFDNLSTRLRHHAHTALPLECQIAAASRRHGRSKITALH